MSGSSSKSGELAPNELGRIMILEYHKVDYPEARWTRTPENFRRDLATLYAKGYRLIALGDLGSGASFLAAFGSSTASATGAARVGRRLNSPNSRPQAR